MTLDPTALAEAVRAAVKADGNDYDYDELLIRHRDRPIAQYFDRVTAAAIAAYLAALPADPRDAEIARLREALEAADATFEVLDPNQTSGLSDAETARLFNATRSLIRTALEPHHD